MDESEKPNVAVVGRFQIGKSTLINCLLDDRVARTGTGIATTKISTIYTYGQVPRIEVARTWKNDLVIWEGTEYRLRDFLHAGKGWEGISASRISLWKPLLSQINLIDTPGIDANADDTAQALASLDQADFALVLLENRGLCDAERLLFTDIHKRGLPFSVVINCRDKSGKRWLPEHNGEIVDAIRAELHNLGLSPIAITGNAGTWPCNLLWFWHASEHLLDDPDGGELCEDIEDYARKHLKRKADSSLTFMQSNFEPIRLFFEHNHWYRISNTDRGKGALAITSPKTLEFIQRFWNDHAFFAQFLEPVLHSCWFSVSPIYKPYRELLAHAEKLSDENNEKQYRWWITDLARIVERHPLPEKFEWSKDAAKALTGWLDDGVKCLAEPYLVHCPPDAMNVYQERIREYARSLGKERLAHEIQAALFALRGDYENLATAWKGLRANAPQIRKYLKSGFFGQIFTEERHTPAVFRENVGVVFDAMSQLIDQGDRIVQPMIETLIREYWNGALEILADIIQELAGHGHNVAALAYDTPASVGYIPWSMDTAFHVQASAHLDEFMGAAGVPDDQKTRLYCLCRRIGIERSDSM